VEHLWENAHYKGLCNELFQVSVYIYERNYLKLGSEDRNEKD
jgi:hypothetical protein